ncbi:hypothetical protein RI054_07g36660 [Pseudoscourfieldia marina]
MGDTERELEAKIERDEATRLKALGDRGCMLELLEFAVDFFEQARHNDSVMHWADAVSNPVIIKHMTDPKFIKMLTHEAIMTRGSGSVGVLIELCKALINCDYDRAREADGHRLHKAETSKAPKLRAHGLFSTSAAPKETLNTRTCRVSFKRFIRSCATKTPPFRQGQRVDQVSDVPRFAIPRLIHFLWKRLEFFSDITNSKNNMSPLVAENALTMLMGLWVEMTPELCVGVFEAEEIVETMLESTESWGVNKFLPSDTCIRGIKMAELYVMKLLEMDPEIVRLPKYAKVRQHLLDKQYAYMVAAGYYAHLRTSTMRSPLPTPIGEAPRLDQRAMIVAESRGLELPVLRPTAFSIKHTPVGWVRVGKSLVRPEAAEGEGRQNQAAYREKQMQENAMSIRVRTDFEPTAFEDDHDDNDGDEQFASNATRLKQIFAEMVEHDQREFAAALIQRRFVEHGVIQRTDTHDLTVEALYLKYETEYGIAPRGHNEVQTPKPVKEKSPKVLAYERSVEKTRHLIDDQRYMRDLAVNKWT